ncbi:MULTISPECIES: hypothetical protein [unclassified Xanthomonas]|uniref:hypothetical protein n=1 Tax=unclassified Xanthomonas TaxID=2643310 RepID=UPI002A7FB3F8|nr:MULTISPECIES: hypothetical protein [unclassified Xanthomonas]MDY4295341.1 hypothetical protein [Xanthomonas sp. LF02-5]MDY4356161.1 hypothetical protein [Xanthomonas sp. LF04-12]
MVAHRHRHLHRRLQALLPPALETHGLHPGNLPGALARSAQAALVTAADRGGALWLRLSERSRAALAGDAVAFLAGALQARAALPGDAAPWRYCPWRAVRRDPAWAMDVERRGDTPAPGFVTWEAEGRARLLVLPAQAALLCRWWR